MWVEWGDRNANLTNVEIVLPTVVLVVDVSQDLLMNPVASQVMIVSLINDKIGIV